MLHIRVLNTRVNTRAVRAVRKVKHVGQIAMITQDGFAVESTANIEALQNAQTNYIVTAGLENVSIELFNDINTKRPQSIKK